MKERIEKVIDGISGLALEAMVVTKIENVHYLSGFSGSSAVAVITRRDSMLITDGRYQEQALREAPSWEVVIYSNSIYEKLAHALSGINKIGFESGATFEFYRKLSNVISASSHLGPTEGVVERLRAIKDETEVQRIKDCLSLASGAFKCVLPLVDCGITERELAAELDYKMVKAGADGPAFSTIVTSGPNASLPHGGLTDRTLVEGDLLILDFGARLRGYHSDTSCTLVVGSADARQNEIIQSVKGALVASIEALEPGTQAAQVDSVARKYIESHGFGENFVHSLGHGVGLEVHEKPTLSPFSNDVLEPGMVFTIEPGVYIEEFGGVRFEEMVYMKSNGAEILSSMLETP